MVKFLYALVIFLLCSSCGSESGPSFKEGVYSVEIECLYNNGDPLTETFTTLSVLSKYKGVWGFSFYGTIWSVAGTPKNGSMIMETAVRKCE